MIPKTRDYGIHSLFQFFLKFNNKKVKYIGKSEVRGIPVRQWQACSFDGTSTSKITVSYSALNWITAENKGSIPIETQISKKGKTSTSNKIYSIIRYREMAALAEEKFYVIEE